MKKTLTFFFLVCVHLAVAEYNGWFIKFSLETIDNEIITGHVYRASAYLIEDSLTNESYTTRKLGGTNNIEVDASFTYFKHRITYTYTPFGATEQAEIYSLVDEQSIPIAQIKSITILEKIDFWYLSGISSSHQMQDTVWMKQAPVQIIISNGYLCSWEVFIHEQTEKTNQVLAELNANSERNKKQIADLEEELKYVDGDDYRKTEVQIDELQENLDQMLSAILAKLNGEKVVIISFCSC